MLRLLLLPALIATALVTALPANARAVCGSSAYSYAGVQTQRAVYGVTATITALAAPQVEDGHVAGWAGVASDNGQGWIQLGLSALPGDHSNSIYLEYASPNRDPRYAVLRTDVAVGERHRFTVSELAGRPGWWRAAVDGTPVGRPVYLPGSHGRWRAEVLGESWNDNSGACNRYAYSFQRVALVHQPDSLWRQLDGVTSFSDAGYGLVWNSRSDFVASTLARR
jgi:hypothetical protein